MNSLLNDNDEDIADSHSGRKQDREITLGTTMVLGIFFALAVLCAVFFGFGYSVGAKRAGGTTLAAESPGSANFSGFKPPSGRAVDPQAPPADSVSAPLTTTPALPRQVAGKPVIPDTPDVTAASVPEIPVRPMLVVAPRAATPAPPVAPAAVPSGFIMVQVAAVSHQEDADTLVTSLKRRGYAVAVHTEPQDKLLHVQVGPFPTHKDADAMRQRIQADGFNAIVKDPSH